jgi:hypothetical protein
MDEYPTEDSEPGPEKKWMTPAAAEMTWTDWVPAHTATCRKGGCPKAVAGGAEWCEQHSAETNARRAWATSDQRQAGQVAAS